MLAGSTKVGLVFLLLFNQSSSFGTCLSAFNIPTQSWQHDTFAWAAQTPQGRLLAAIRNRNPQQQRLIDEAATDYHELYGNTFTRINPETQDKEHFTPQVSALPLLLAESQFNAIVDSTAPIMTQLRKILQFFYSSQDGRRTRAQLILPDATDAEKDEIVGILESSIYLEPQLLETPEFRDYPFLPIARFDGVFENPASPEPVFFEYNSGTPSGLSNLDQLIEAYAQHDPNSFATIQPVLPVDTSFASLRNAITSAAASWTGDPNGLVVTLSPGPLNGAHPDIVRIAELTGMPLVQMSDLFLDENGLLRLNADDFPVVRGIYSRTEESYLLQSTQHGIPLRSPYFANNAEIGARFGLELQPFIAYKFFYDDVGEVSRVEVDQNGQPVLQDAAFPLAKDPRRPNAPLQSLLQSVRDRKVYVSNLGGRIVDDKKLFSLVSGIARRRAKNAARPPEELTTQQAVLVFTNAADLSEYVVKEPNNSGGVGVYILGMLDAAERDNIRRLYLQNPNHFVVQRRARLTSTVVARDHATFDNRVVDLGIFVYQDAAGNVTSGSRSILPRIANLNSLSTNTSQGAGYGIAIVTTDSVQKKVVPSKTVAAKIDLPLSRQKVAALEAIIGMLAVVTTTPPAQEHFSQRVDSLGDLLTEHLEIFGRSFLPMLHDVREFQSAKYNAQHLVERLKFWINELHNSAHSADGGKIHNMAIARELRRLI